MPSLKDYFPHIIKLDEVSPYAGGIGQRAGLGTAPAAVTGFAKIKQPPQAREKGFPYRAYEEDETSAKDNEYVDDIDIALDFRNKINPFRIDMTVMSDPGHKYDNARSAQMKQQVRGGTHQNIEFEEEIDESWTSFFKDEERTERALDQAHLLKIASSPKGFIRLPPNEKKAVAEIIGTGYQGYNEDLSPVDNLLKFAKSPKEFIWDPTTDAGIGWKNILNKMKIVQNKILDTNKPVEISTQLEEISTDVAYSGAKGRPAAGHRGAGTHVKPSSSGGRDRGGSSIARHIGPHGWSSAPLTEPEEEDYYVVDDEADSSIIKYIKKNIQSMIPELNVRGVHGPGGNAGGGRFGGHHGINTWAKGITYQSDIIDKTKTDLRNTDIYKLIRWYEDSEREKNEDEEYDV